MEEETILLSDLSNYRLISKENWEKIKGHIYELSRSRDTWKDKYDELNKRHLALCVDHHHLSCTYRGYMQVARAHNIDPKEILAAIEEYEKETKQAKAVLDPDEERDFYEDDYPGWGNK